jgi:hypothetical protein
MSEDQLADYAVGSPTRLALNVLAHKWTLRFSQRIGRSAVVRMSAALAMAPIR